MPQDLGSCTLTPGQRLVAAMRMQGTYAFLSPLARG